MLFQATRHSNGIQTSLEMFGQDGNIALFPGRLSICAAPKSGNISNQKILAGRMAHPKQMQVKHSPSRHMSGDS